MNAIRSKELQYSSTVYKLIGKYNEKLNEYEGFVFNDFVDILDEEFGLSTEEEDTKFSYDFVYQIKDIVKRTTGFRCRSFQYMKYNDISIRSKTSSGYRCELDKIMSGLGQYNVFAYENETKNEIVKAYLIDMDAIRTLTRQKKYKTIKMFDGSFNVYSIEDISHLGYLIDTYNINH